MSRLLDPGRLIPLILHGTLRWRLPCQMAVGLSWPPGSRWEHLPGSCQWWTGNDRVSGGHEGLDCGRGDGYAARYEYPCAGGSAGSWARSAWWQNLLLSRPKGRSGE